MKTKTLKSGIVGFPLNKPRSLTIWNAYIKSNNINAKFFAHEIKHNNFNLFMKHYLNDVNFLSTLITMPYKKLALKYANKLDSSARNANSCNLLVKKYKKIYAYNTDVIGAYKSVSKYMKKFDNILIIGLGGTGEAIFRFLYHKYKKKNFSLISQKFFFKSKRVSINKKLENHLLSDKFFIINCTPLGSDLKKKYIKISPIKKSSFKYMNKKNIIFDIVYKPKNTYLSKLCTKYNINYINGINMNSIQAEMGLKFTFKDV